MESPFSEPRGPWKSIAPLEVAPFPATSAHYSVQMSTAYWLTFPACPSLCRKTRAFVSFSVCFFPKHLTFSTSRLRRYTAFCLP